VLTAHDQKNKAGSAFELEHNLRWFCKATGAVALEPTINSRETTPAEDSQSDDEDEEKASAVDRLVISFKKLLALDNLQNGLQLGTNPTGRRRESTTRINTVKPQTRRLQRHIFL